MMPRALGGLRRCPIADGGARRGRVAPRFLSAAVLLFGILLLAGRAEAATYYFSNCATGGSGTQSNPYCLDPTGTGNKTSFRYLMDGSSPDVVAGDTIYLCAGACDGSGSGTFNLGVSGNASNGDSFVFAPVVSGTASAPITISGYTGESVVLSGDTNNNGIPEATEPDILVTNTTSSGANRAWYVWKNFTAEKFQTNVFYLNANPANWTFDNIEVRYTSTEMWNGGTIYAAGCTNEMGGFVFKVADLNAPLTIKNSRFHHICGAVHRYTVNQGTGTQFLHENNEYYNISTVDNEFMTRNVTWRGNYLHDFYDGISMEDEMVNVVIEDNIVACPGDYKVGQDGRCGTGITVNDGNNGNGGKTKNITIRRNKMYGGVDGVYGGPNVGYLFCALTILATNDTEPINIVVENNMIWHHWSWTQDITCSAGIGVKSNRNEVTVQNNTLYDTANGISLDAYVPGIAYTVRNNLVVRANKNGSNRPEITVSANAIGSTIVNNNFHHDGQGDPVMRIGSSNYSCSQVGGYQSGNKCQATAFVRSSGTPVKDWDLHLASTDAANRNAGIAGPTDDIDKAPRGSAPIDIGADEFGGAGGGLTAALVVETGGLPAPSSGGIYYLKAGTYTVRLTSSAQVIAVPTPLTFTASGGGTTVVTLAGTIPGTLFTGTLTIGTSVAEGTGTFSLPASILNDGQGNRGQLITSGASAVVDRTPPAAPTGVRTQ